MVRAVHKSGWSAQERDDDRDANLPLGAVRSLMRRAMRMAMGTVVRSMRSLLAESVATVLSTVVMILNVFLEVGPGDLPWLLV